MPTAGMPTGVVMLLGMYRVPAIRPDDVLEVETRPPARLAVKRETWAGPLPIGLAWILGLVVVWDIGSFAGLLVPILVLGSWTSFLAFVMARSFRPTFVEIDFAAQRVRSAPHERGFDEIAYARVDRSGGVATIVLVSREGEEVCLARGERSSAAETATAINVALAERYESLRAMPDGLRDAMKRADRGLPLSGFANLAHKDKRARIEAILRALPVADLHFQHGRDNAVEASGTVRSTKVRFFYSFSKDRAEVVAAIKSPHGNLRLRRVDGHGAVGDGWVSITGHVAINGATNFAKFESFPRRERIVSEMERLHLRDLGIHPEETRAVSRDGLRELRDPQARLSGMLDLVVEVVESLGTPVGR